MTSLNNQAEAPMTNKDFFMHMENLACLVSSKIEVSLAPIRLQQEELRSDLSSIESRVANIEGSSEQNRANIEALQRQMTSLSKGVTSDASEPLSENVSDSRSLNQPRQRLVSSSSIIQCEASEIIWHAKRILGFSPISDDKQFLLKFVSHKTHQKILY